MYERRYRTSDIDNLQIDRREQWIEIRCSLPEKNYELRGCELYCGNEPCDNSKEKNSGCIILDIRTGKRVV